MKTAKKLTALLLAVVMVLAMSVSAFAATTDTGLSGTVTVKFTKNYSDNKRHVQYRFCSGRRYGRSCIVRAYTYGQLGC